MARPALLTLLLCLLGLRALATPLSPTPFSPGDQCRVAIAAAERAHGIPPQLLASIGRVESGRRDPVTGAWSPWPWTINAEGQGAFFASKAEVIQAVLALQARGVRSIDVGCMQVNLMHHPNAFATLDMAFEPAINADYAARFLLRLHEQTGDWTTATADYHSSDPAEGGPYAAKVASVLPEEQRRASGALSPMAGGVMPVIIPVPPFPAHPPARLFAMAGTPPMMAPGGGSPLALPSVRPVPAFGAPAGFGRPAAFPGRDLASYRATPIRPDMAFHAPLRFSNGMMPR